ARRYKKAHAHNAGAHIWCTNGFGYSLLWREGIDKDPTNAIRIDWRPGVLYAPPDGPTFHQHFNLAPEGSRYLALAFGGVRYPVLESKTKNYETMDQSDKNGGMQKEYEDEDPRIFELYTRELAKNGLTPDMEEWVGKKAVAV